MQRETKVKELEVRLSSQDGAETEQNAPEKSEDREADSSANITCPSTNKILERDAKLIGALMDPSNTLPLPPYEKKYSKFLSVMFGSQIFWIIM